jgi:integrase
MVRYLQIRKRDGALYYQRRVPADLIKHYGHPHIREHLKTKDLKEAAKRIGVLAARDDSLWKTWRSGEAPTAPKDIKIAAQALLKQWGLTPGGGGGEWYEDGPLERLLDKYGDDLHERERLPAGPQSAASLLQRDEAIRELLTPTESEAWRMAYETPGKREITISDALAMYLDTHPRGKARAFLNTTNIAIKHVFDSVGDLPLRSFDRAKARLVRDNIAKGGKASGTVRRRLRSVAAVFNKAILEFELRDITNPFQQLDIADEGLDTESRVPFSTPELEVISRACRAKNDPIRHIAAFQLDTGARLGEIVGLRIEDVFLEAAIPHIWIRENLKLGRSLKTPGSNRKVPLVGVSLWAAREQLKITPAPIGWLFPQYASDRIINTNTASQTLNKWLRTLLRPTGRTAKATTHCFRHSMKDRLRDARVPKDVQEALLGHGTRSVADGYGLGFTLENLEENLRAVVLPNAKG